MIGRRLLLTAMLIASISVGVGVGVGAASGAPTDSGIHGLVLYGPTCPVQRAGVSCERPLVATVLVSRAGSTRWLSRTRSGRDGRFTFDLRPGRFLVRARTSAAIVRTLSEVVSVSAHRFTAVTLRVDSGIR